MVVLTGGGRLLLRSRAALECMQRLGGVWRALAMLGWLVPTALADRIYDGVAKVRYRLFGQPVLACPLLPPELRERFELMD